MNTFPLTNRTLGTLGLIGAPLLLIGMLLLMKLPELRNTPFDGLHGLVFMLAWMASLVGLIRMRATGSSLFGRLIIRANLVTLTLANLWNIAQAIEPGANTPIHRFLDAFWPISMSMMLPVGITVAVVGNLRGWRRYGPLLAGLTLPLNVLSMQLSGVPLLMDPAQQPDTRLVINLLTGLHVTIGWGLIAYTVRSTP